MATRFQLEMSLSSAHRNRYLFSDHYLEHILAEDPRWDEALSETAEFLVWLQDLYAHEKAQLPQYNEGSLEAHWFRPILEQLGHVFEPQPTVPGLDAYAKRPDYVFFPDEEARRAAAGLQNEEEYADNALAAGEVKRWDRQLGKKRKGGGPSFEDRNPSWQIDYYVRTTGLDWGILTNGRLWRLVHEDTSHRLQIYYEVDLVQLVQEANPERLRYFSVFFRQAALRPDEQGRVFLDDALAASSAYAVELEQDLEHSVYRALERLIQGFLDLPPNDLASDDLKEIYDNSLYLLYRLLFILYGESRGLLPLDNDQYRTNYSLSRIKEEIADLEVTPAPRTTLYWGHLKNLFHIINGDDAELNRSLGVPRYNGGLFDPQQHPFLEEKQVGDRALVQAIDLLSRRRTDAGREFADYRTLGVRHLGSIYEGLLEYRPRYAGQPLLAIRDGRDERWVEASEAPEDGRVIERRGTGEVYLETDRGERKATGSYYTPQYIVEYIVEHAVGPLVEEVLDRVRARAKAAETKAARAEAEQSVVDEILDLKVLDPAMGSGHFLVEATEFLALELATDPYVETEETPEEDLTYWKRRVVERCIYGVDKNPLAVELAKLSLWLATVAAHRPLSFLDHHLKCGDSLIGAQVADLGWAPPPVLSKKAQKQVEQQKAEQINMFEHVLSQMLPTVMGRILEITEQESKDYDTVRAKEATDQAVRELKEPFEAVADLWTSGYFGNECARGDYQEALGVISQPDTLLALEPVQRARAIAQERRFFHWELAFPEVFYDENGRRLKERAGFDAVVGNPPYLFLSGRGSPTKRLEKEGRLAEARSLQREIDYLSERFSRSSAGCKDYYKWFIERSLEGAREGGWLSLVVSNTWIAYPKFKDIRTLLAVENQLLALVDIGGEVFEDPTVLASVFVARKSGAEERSQRPEYADLKQYARKTLVDSSLSKVVEAHSRALSLDKESVEFQIYTSPVALRILRELADDFGFSPFTIREGEHDLKIDKDELRSQPSPGTVPVIRDWEMSRYLPPSIGFLPERLAGVPISTLHQGPRLFLRKTGDTLLAAPPPKVEDNGEHGSRPVARGTRGPAAASPRRPFKDGVAHQNVYVVKITERSVRAEYICALFNSSLLTHAYQNSPFGQPGRVQAQLRIDFISRLPFRRIQFTTSGERRGCLVQQAKARAKEVVENLVTSGATRPDTPLNRTILSQAAAPVLSFVEGRLSAEPEQADVVHDLLAYLAERMIAMHEEKQERIEAFWLDLEGASDAETFEDLREHGKWGRSLWRASEACRPFVCEESRSTRHLEESLGWDEDCFKVFVKELAGKVSNLSDVVAVYRKHHTAYRQLVQRIEATDLLIDQIVYKLYALTEGEIAVVEGTEN